MPFFGPLTPRKDLEKVVVKESDSLSKNKFFGVSEFPQEFTSGKNAFLIRGSKYLTNDAKVQIEVIDSGGNGVSVELIQHYLEDSSRLAIINVYNNTVNGEAKVFILGVCDKDDQGNTVPNYLVRFEQNIIIANQKVNVTPIRL